MKKPVAKKPRKKAQPPAPPLGEPVNNRILYKPSIQFAQAMAENRTGSFFVAGEFMSGNPDVFQQVMSTLMPTAMRWVQELLCFEIQGFSMKFAPLRPGIPLPKYDCLFHKTAPTDELPDGKLEFEFAPIGKLVN